MKRRLMAATLGGVLVTTLAGATSNSAVGAYEVSEQTRDGQRPLMSASALYRCKVRNPVQDQAYGGKKDFRFGYAGRFPVRVDGGTTVNVGRFRSRTKMFRALVRFTKKEMGVERVRFRPRAHLIVAGAKKRTRPTDLAYSAWKKLRPRRSLALHSTGRVDFKAPAPARRLKLLLPKRFSTVEGYRPPILGSVSKDKWKCKVRKNVSRKDRLIGTIKVR